MNSPIYKLSDSYIDRLAALDPGAATYMGIPGHDHEMTDFSPAGHDARAALDQNVLTQLNALDASADADRLAAGVLRESLEMGTLEYAANEHLRSIRVIAGDVDAGRSIFDLMPTDTAEQWSVIAERLLLACASRGHSVRNEAHLGNADKCLHRLSNWVLGQATALHQHSLNNSLKVLLQFPVRQSINCAQQQRLLQRHSARHPIICATNTHRLQMPTMVSVQIVMPSRDVALWA
jgi:uncharacterized protein (DUF885 family)